jgi:hypothetical protein
MQNPESNKEKEKIRDKKKIKSLFISGILYVIVLFAAFYFLLKDSLTSAIFKSIFIPLVVLFFDYRLYLKNKRIEAKAEKYDDVAKMDW